MNKIDENLSDILKRYNFIFKNKEITVECVKNVESFSIVTDKFGPFETGKKYKLKQFLAEPFIKNNAFKIVPAEKCDNIDVQRYTIAERDDQKLVRQENNDFLLDKIKEFKSFIKKEVNDGTKLRRDLENYNSYFSNLIDSRLDKLLRMSKSTLSEDEQAKLTISEKILFKRVNELVISWKNHFLSI